MSSLHKNSGSCSLYECKEKGCQNFGSSNRLIYDRCAYQKELYESTSPLAYRLYEGAQENCKKCMHNNEFYRPFDLVDIESELLNITRPNTHCPQFKYNPNCKTSKLCTSTFSKDVPIVPAPEVCPIVFNNIPRMTNKGYEDPSQSFCGRFKPMQTR